MNESTTPFEVYVASPLGFTEAGRCFNIFLLDELRAAGIHPLDPWSVEEGALIVQAKALPLTERLHALAQANYAVGTANERGIRQASAMLAVLDGPDVDSGTAAEIGFAAALGKPIAGLRTDWRVSGDEGSIVNLQVEFWCSCIETTLDEAIEALVRFRRRG